MAARTRAALAALALAATARAAWPAVALPLEPGLGLDVTWFLSQRADLEARPLAPEAPARTGALRLVATGERAFARIDHLPVHLEAGDHALEVRIDTRAGATLELALLRLVATPRGVMPVVARRRVEIAGGGAARHVLALPGLDAGIYLPRIRATLYRRGATLDLADVRLHRAGRAPPPRPARMRPWVEGVVHAPGERVRLGAEVVLDDPGEHRLGYAVRRADGSPVGAGSGKTYSGPGRFAFEATVTPPGSDLYVATFTLERGEEQPLVLQKAFSVLPAGDSPTLGLHARGPRRARRELELGRTLGFRRLRDHDFGMWTRWSRVQPADGGGAGRPPVSFAGEATIRYLVRELGYDYLGVLFDAPRWALDRRRSLPGHPFGVPRLDAWRAYVRAMVEHYTYRTGLVSEWEIWNEGKGVIGARLDDPRIYAELLRAAVDEVDRLAAAHGGRRPRLVAFAGIHSARIWDHVLDDVRGFDVVSSHWKARRLSDTYLPALRPGRTGDPLGTRDGWLRTAARLLERHRAPLEHWDTEFGITNPVYPVYSFLDAPGDGGRVGIPIADRSAQAWPDGVSDPANLEPVGALEGAAILSRQVVAHRAQGVTRLYLYYLMRRDFASPIHEEHALEYDGTLKAPLHALVLAAKTLDGTVPAGRRRHGRSVVEERFRGPRRRVSVLWNERDGRDRLAAPPAGECFTYMGRAVPAPAAIGPDPIFCVQGGTGP